MIKEWDSYDTEVSKASHKSLIHDAAVLSIVYRDKKKKFLVEFPALFMGGLNRKLPLAGDHFINNPSVCTLPT